MYSTIMQMTILYLFILHIYLNELIIFLQQEGNPYRLVFIQLHAGKSRKVSNYCFRQEDKSPVFSFDTVNITCDEVVKLLGVDIDFNLNIDSHINNIFEKAAQQLNVMRRIGHNSAVHGFQTRLRSDKNYTHRSKG